MSKDSENIAYIKGTLDTFVKNQDALNTKLDAKLEKNEDAIGENKALIANVQGKATVWGIVSGILASVLMGSWGN